MKEEFIHDFLDSSAKYFERLDGLFQFSPAQLKYKNTITVE